jgi:hypothetical protein
VILQHIDVGMYYLRQKQFYEPKRMGEKWTTTDTLFDGNISGQYKEFTASPGSFVWDLDGVIARYVLGEMPRMGRPWVEVDFVYIPVNVDASHWVLAVFDVENLQLRVFDSLGTGALHDAKVNGWMERYALMIPSICRALVLAQSRPAFQRMGDTLAVELVPDTPEQDNRFGGLVH